MAFELSERHIDEFKTRGYTVFRQIVPPSLIRDLRAASDDARRMAREKGGPQVQRLQPVGAYEIDQRPFADFSKLPDLVDAVASVLTPLHNPSSPETCGILLEPAEQPYCTTWHRDGRRGPGPHEEWRRLFHHIDFFNQTNCPLYRDSSLWYVPGSHLRPDDFRREAPLDRVGPKTSIELDGTDSEERERVCNDYVLSMPGAVRLDLEAGDYALYRSNAWHLGSYVPYTKRATLHDYVDTPAFYEWRQSGEGR